MTRKEISERATRRAAEYARERHQRIEGERLRRLGMGDPLEFAARLGEADRQIIEGAEQMLAIAAREEGDHS